MNKAIFLDRDGVLIDDLHYNCDINKIRLNKNLIPILRELQREYLLIVITNQSGVARGYFSILDVQVFNNYLIEKLAKLGVNILDVFVCPHYEYGVIKQYATNCNCRKPKPELIFKAQEKYNIDLKQSFLIGDKDSDILCGENAGLKHSFNITHISLVEINKIIKNSETHI